MKPAAVKRPDGDIDVIFSDFVQPEDPAESKHGDCPIATPASSVSHGQRPVADPHHHHSTSSAALWTPVEADPPRIRTAMLGKGDNNVVPFDEESLSPHDHLDGPHHDGVLVVLGPGRRFPRAGPKLEPIPPHAYTDTGALPAHQDA